MFDVERPEFAASVLVVAAGGRGGVANEQQLGSPELELAETQELVRAAAAKVVDSLSFSLNRTDPSTFITSGKLATILERLESSDADTVVLNLDPSPSQQRNLERELKRRVVTRTELILEIFSRRAQTHEGKLQVELARLMHLSTRLVRGWTHLDRQRGGFNLRGAGETQLELDQRLIGERIKQTQQRLARVRRRRAEGRKSRLKRDALTVALIGYTNAGKSTLFNRLTHAEVMAKDLLFATLDPTLRRVRITGVGDVVLADTVGFIRRLPHRLIEAFKATLEEVAAADLLLHVIDAADPEWRDQVAAVQKVLAEIGADQVPLLPVMNKIDRVDQERLAEQRLLANGSGAVWISAASGEGLPTLLKEIEERLGQGALQCIRLRPAESRLRAWLYEQGLVLGEENQADGDIQLSVRLNAEQHARVARMRQVN